MTVLLRLGLLLLLVVPMLGTFAPRDAGACTISCVGTSCSCSGSGDCVITNSQPANGFTPNGALIDCSGRHVRVAGQNGNIVWKDGFFTLRAAQLTVEAGRSVRAERNGTSSTVPYGMTIELAGQLSLSGYLSARHSKGGGRITVKAGGDISILDDGAQTVGIDAGGTAAHAPGGAVTLVSGRHVTIADPIRADTPSGSTGIAEGGVVDINAAGNVTVNQEINTFGRQARAGDIVIVARGQVDLAGAPIGDPPPACTSGAATGVLAVNAALKAEGGNTNGDGGEIHLTARKVSLAASVSARGGLNASGGESQGGMVDVVAGDCGVQVNAGVDVTGGAAGSGQNGGAALIESDGDISIAPGVTIVTRSQGNGGDGGDVSLEARGRLTLGANALIDARGHSGSGATGVGADVGLRACQVQIDGGARIDATGYDGGSISLIARETARLANSSRLDVTGLVGSGGAHGEIILETRLPGMCAANLDAACLVASCLPTGGGTSTCSNDPQRSCVVDANCTSCANSGSCLANPDTGGSSAPLVPASAAQTFDTPSLVPCE